MLFVCEMVYNTQFRLVQQPEEELCARRADDLGDKPVHGHLRMRRHFLHPRFQGTAPIQQLHATVSRNININGVAV